MKNIKESLTFIVIPVIILLLMQHCTQSTKQEIAEWRGPNRTGIYNETELLNEWPEDGPDLLWAYEGLGKGYAAPVIYKNKIFVNGEQDSSSYLFALDMQGSLLWKSPNGKEFMGEGFSNTYPGSRSTPTIVNDLVYSTSGQGRIACFDARTGTEKWAVDIVKDFNSSIPFFGYSESVIVDDDKVYCFPAGPETNTAALDRFTGELVWSSQAKKDTFSYCSPILVELPKGKVIVTHSRHNLYAINCNTGEALGSYKIKDYQYDGEHCNSPIYADGFIYFIGNEKECGAVKLNLSEDGGKISEVWCNPKIKNNFNGYVKVDNKLFTTVKGNWLIALDDETGTVSDSLKVATGSLIYADNKFICYGMNGEVNLIQNNQGILNIAGNFKVTQGTDHHFSHPVLANGIMYIRHGNTLLAYNIK